MALLNVDKLSVHFGDENAPFRAVDRISYSVKQGEVVGIVGESGSGKSVSSLAIMGLIDYPGRVMADKLEFNGRDLQRISEKERRQTFSKQKKFGRRFVPSFPRNRPAGDSFFLDPLGHVPPPP